MTEGEEGQNRYAIKRFTILGITAIALVGVLTPILHHDAPPRPVTSRQPAREPAPPQEETPPQKEVVHPTPTRRSLADQRFLERCYDAAFADLVKLGELQTTSNYQREGMRAEFRLKYASQKHDIAVVCSIEEQEKIDLVKILVPQLGIYREHQLKRRGGK